jgi:hypothetical protein
MPRRVLWTSWSKFEADFELERIAHLGLKYEWVSAHRVPPTPDDIWLSTNGGNYFDGPFKKATVTAESYQYLVSDYENYPIDTKWDHRFHFNPNYYRHPKTSHLNIMTWWQHEKQLFDTTARSKSPEFMFGMVLGKKPPKRHPYEFGWFRTEVVEKARGRSFKYYGFGKDDKGNGWDSADPNFGGEAYVHGNRGTPAKFHDARILMSKSKFVFCFENIHDPVYSMNYMTEKIFHGFIAAAVPIYCGCWNIEEVISPDLFIDIRKFDYDMVKVMDYCEAMGDIEYNGYLERIGRFLEGPGQQFTCEKNFLNMDQRLHAIFGW